MAIKLIIFDLGGVLTFSRNKNDPYIKLKKRYNILDEDFSNFLYKYFDDYHFNRTLSQYNFWKKTLMQVKEDISPEEINETIDLSNEVMVNEFNPKMINFIKERSQKYKFALLSNSSRDMDLKIFSSEIIRYFDKICLTHINSEKKPNEEAYQKILDGFKLTPSEVIFIDDKEKNILGAKKLGIKTIHFKNYEDFVQDFNKLIDKI